MNALIDWIRRALARADLRLQRRIAQHDAQVCHDEMARAVNDADVVRYHTWYQRRRAALRDIERFERCIAALSHPTA